MTEMTEQRDSDRIAVSYNAEVQYQGLKIGEATIKDLSERGLQIYTEHEVEEESDLVIKVWAEESGIPPLILFASVVRVSPSPEGPGYLLGCMMK